MGCGEGVAPPLEQQMRSLVSFNDYSLAMLKRESFEASEFAFQVFELITRPEPVINVNLKFNPVRVKVKTANLKVDGEV